MRLKPFLIFIALFTAFYILFWSFIDNVSTKISNEREKKKAFSLISNKTYAAFARFYGIQSVANEEIIKSIYNYIQHFFNNISISQEALKYNISTYEYAVIVTYLEYLDLLSKRVICLERNMILLPSSSEQNLISRYYSSLADRLDFNAILALYGNRAYNDLYYMNEKFLIPGVRFINNTIYYIGDIYEQ